MGSVYFVAAIFIISDAYILVPVFLAQSTALYSVSIQTNRAICFAVAICYLTMYTALR